MAFNSKPTIASRNIQRPTLISYKRKKKKTVKKSKTITRSHFSHHHTTSLSRVWPVNTLFTNNISSSVENEVRSLTYILDAHKTHTTSYILYAAMHPARLHDSWPPFCLKGFIYAKLHKLLCDVTGRHYNARNSDVSLSRAPCGLGGGDG